MHKVQSETIAARMYEIRAASAASGGTALTTAASLISLPLGSDWVSITSRNFAGGATVVRFSFNPYLFVIKTSNSLTSTGDVTDLSAEAQDGDATAMIFDSFDTAANGDYLYIGSEIPFRGVAVDMAADANGAASGTLTVKYWDGSAWVDISATDGTNDATRTFGQDGNVTWTVPSAWTQASLVAIGDTSLAAYWSNAPMYWTRWQTSVVFDSSVDVDQFRALNRSTAYAELIEGQAFEMGIRTKGQGAISCVEALTDSGTANLIVNVATLVGGEDFS